MKNKLENNIRESFKKFAKYDVETLMQNYNDLMYPKIKKAEADDLETQKLIERRTGAKFKDNSYE